MGSVSACSESAGLGASCRELSFEQPGQALAGVARPPSFGGVGLGGEGGEGVGARAAHQVDGDDHATVLGDRLGGTVGERGPAVTAGRDEVHADAVGRGAYCVIPFTYGDR